MWAVTPEWLTALKSGHRYSTQCTYTVPGGSPVAFAIESGSVQVDRTQASRRQATVSLRGKSSDFVAMRTPGTLFQIRHGLFLNNTDQLVPVFTGELQKGAQNFGGGVISLPMQDLNLWIARVDFLTPYAPAATTARTDAITAIVQGARPGTTVLNLSSDTGTVGYKQVWADARQDAINDLTQDGGTEAFFYPDGSYVIRDKQSIYSTPVWTTQGVLKSVERSRETEFMFNTVVIDREHVKKQRWSRQIAQITDLANPRHPNYIGVVVKKITSGTAKTAAEAFSIAQSTLDSVIGNPETLSLDAVSNPALEAGDAIRVITPQLNEEPAQIFQHFLDSFSIDLVTGDMSASTRSMAVVT